jgi:hypothetical protein
VVVMMMPSSAPDRLRQILPIRQLTGLGSGGKLAGKLGQLFGG